ncbi:HTH domain-containing protein [Methylobacterium sp. WSM2598]|uniref:HTH domain-containing protein n=1 Tax=Methylobacterium sp. WSM2598 TaxID=398261 RepID=UPI00036F80EC|nr:HTH domain-containing protein [Methylobacterium sp. WSM2598]
MVLSEAEVRARLEALRQQRAALDRAIAEHELYLELGRRLAAAEPAPAQAPPAPAPTAQARAQASVQASAQATLHPATPHPAAPASPRSAGPPAAGGRAEGRRVIEAAFAVLAAAGRPMHAAEIWEAIAARGHTLPGHDPVAALNTRLWKRAQGGTALRRLGDGVYALDAPVKVSAAP